MKVFDAEKLMLRQKSFFFDFHIYMMQNNE